MNLAQLMALKAELRNKIASVDTNAENANALLTQYETELRKINMQIENAETETPKEERKDETQLSIEAREMYTRTTPDIIHDMATRQMDVSCENDLEKRISTLVQELRAGKEIEIDSQLGSVLEKRAIASTVTLIENKYSRTVEGHMNEVSQTIDIVNPVMLDGGNQWSVAYAISGGTADYTDEAAVYATTEGTFAKDDAGRKKITGSTIVNEEVIDLPNADYISIIYADVRNAIRKKISQQIISGTGANDTIKGILKAPETAIPANYKVDVTAVDKNTLIDIVMTYGNDEDVTSPLTLCLNKKTLAEFAKVEKANGDKYYNVNYTGSNGYLEADGLRVPYTINSALKDFATASADEIVMIYGDFSKYDLAMYSPITIKTANERYIDQGQVGFFGKVYAGGVVKAHKAFLPVKKKIV